MNDALRGGRPQTEQGPVGGNRASVGPCARARRPDRNSAQVRQHPAGPVSCPAVRPRIASLREESRASLKMRLGAPHVKLSICAARRAFTPCAHPRGRRIHRAHTTDPGRTSSGAPASCPASTERSRTQCCRATPHAGPRRRVVPRWSCRGNRGSNRPGRWRR